MIVTSGHTTMLFKLFQRFSHIRYLVVCTQNYAHCTKPVSQHFRKTWILTSQWIYSSVLWCGCIWLSMKTMDTHNLSFSKVTNRTNGFESRWTPLFMRTNHRPFKMHVRHQSMKTLRKLNENIHESSRGKVTK